MERILLRDRVLVIISLAVLSVLSWIYLAVLAMDMAEGDMSLMGQNMAAGSMVAMTATMNVSVHIFSDVDNVVGDDGRHDGAFRRTDDFAIRLGYAQAG